MKIRKITALLLSLLMVIVMTPNSLVAYSDSYRIEVNGIELTASSSAVYAITNTDGSVVIDGSEDSYNIKLEALSGIPTMTLNDANISGDIDLSDGVDYTMILNGKNTVNGNINCTDNTNHLLIKGASKDDSLTMVSNNDTEIYSINPVWYELSFENCSVSVDTISQANVGLDDVLSLTNASLTVAELQWMSNGGISLSNSSLTVGSSNIDDYSTFWVENIALFDNSTIKALTPISNYGNVTTGFDTIKPYLDSIYMVGVPDNQSEPLTVLKDGIPSTFTVSSAITEIESVSPEVSSISVKVPPVDTTYTYGDNFDPTGLIITVIYSDGTTEDIAYNDNPSSLSFDLESLEVADEEVIVTYEGKTASISIEVEKQTVDTPVIKSKTFNNTKLTADVETNGKPYTVKTNSGGINVGVYDVILSLNDPSNYKWNDSNDVTKVVKFSITKAESLVLNVNAVMIKNSDNYTSVIELTDIAGYPVNAGGTPKFAVTSNKYNGLISVSLKGSKLTLVADNTSNDKPDVVTVKVTGMGNYKDTTVITISVDYSTKNDAVDTSISSSPKTGYGINFIVISFVCGIFIITLIAFNKRKTNYNRN